MPICIAGMHRSGTSLVARLLHSLGLDLGPESDLLPAGLGNPEGHWENTRFNDLNDLILELAGGAWDRVPAFEAGWQDDAKFDPILEPAAALVNSFAGRELWGWKDPRNSLTLPFWRRLIPDLRVVLCVRNPLEVAESLRLRNEFPAPTGVCLWADYSARALSAVERERRLVTHYESYFLDFRAEAARLANFAGLNEGEATIDALRPVANESLRHNRAPLRDFLDGRIQDDFVRLYLEMCLEAGPVYERHFPAQLADAFDASAGRHTSGSPLECLSRLACLLAAKERTTKELRSQLDGVWATLREYQAAVEAYRDRTANLDNRIAALVERLKWKRYAWADRVANWLERIRPDFRRHGSDE